jgi:hypothetical protein
VRDVQPFQGGEGDLAASRTRDLSPAQRQLDVAADAGGEQARSLGRVGDPAAQLHSPALRADSVHCHFTGVRRLDGSKKTQQGRLPGAVGTEYREVLSASDNQAVHTQHLAPAADVADVGQAQLCAHDAPGR